MLSEQLNRIKTLMNLQESTTQTITSLLPQLAAAAQNVYDQWDQDQEGIDDVYGGGGICDDIADAFCTILQNHNLDCTTQYNEYDTHTSTYVSDHETHTVYNVDIHPSHYEKGYGYNWTKIPNVQFKPNMISVNQITWEDFHGEDNENTFY